MTDVEFLEVILEIQGVFGCLVLMFYPNAMKIMKKHKILQAIIFFDMICMASAVVTILNHGREGSRAFWIMQVTNYLMCFSLAMIVEMMAEYIKSLLNIYKSQHWIWIVRALITVMMGLVVTNPFFQFLFYIGEDNEFHRGTMMTFVMFGGVVTLLLQAFIVSINYDYFETSRLITLISLPVFPMIGLVLQAMNIGYSLFNIGLSLSVFTVFFGSLYELNASDKEKDMIIAEEKAYLLNSQIKPHFLFNSLNVIQALIDVDPELAKEAIGQFAQYYRKSLNMDYIAHLISIWTEIEYVKNYLYLEQLRFGRKLKIVYDLDETLDFDIPFLSIQPLVENAVKHGVRNKVEGGTVTIRTYESGNNAIVEVIDDGIGFGMKSFGYRADKKGAGVGLDNVKERIHLMTGGEVNIESALNVGTKVQLVIPLKNNNRYLKST